MSEDKVEDTVVEPTEVTPAEEKARADGWRPKEEWNGPEDQWVDFNEFNLRGELMGRISEQSSIIHNQSKRLDEMSQTMKDFKEMHEKVAETEYKKILKQLRVRKAQAIEEGDAAAVVELEEQMDDLKETREASKAAAETSADTTAQQQGMNPEVQAWVSAPQNQWYNTNKVMQHTANAIAAEIAANNPALTPGQVLAEMDKEMRKEMPHKFSNNPVGSGDTTQRSSSSSSASKRQLTDEEKDVGRRFVKEGLFKSLDEYAEQLDAIGD